MYWSGIEIMETHEVMFLETRYVTMNEKSFVVSEWHEVQLQSKI